MRGRLVGVRACGCACHHCTRGGGWQACAGVRFACHCARGGAGRRVCGLAGVRATAHEAGLSRLACTCAGGLRAKGVWACGCVGLRVCVPLHTRRGQAGVCGLRATAHEEVLSGVCAGEGCAVCVPIRKRRGLAGGCAHAWGFAGVRLAHQYARGGAGRRVCGRGVCGCAACVPIRKRRGLAGACGRGETCVLLCQQGRRVCGLAVCVPIRKRRGLAGACGRGVCGCAVCVGACGCAVCALPLSRGRLIFAWWYLTLGWWGL